MLKISVCLVVCLPLLIFPLISPVLVSASGKTLLRMDDLPTPEGPASAVVLFCKTSLISSIPLFSVTLDVIILEPHPENLLSFYQEYSCPPDLSY